MTAAERVSAVEHTVSERAGRCTSREQPITNRHESDSGVGIRMLGLGARDLAAIEAQRLSRRRLHLLAGQKSDLRPLFLTEHSYSVTASIVQTVCHSSQPTERFSEPNRQAQPRKR